MAFELSFAEEFFMPEGCSLDGPYPEASDRPTCVLQALLSLSEEELEFMRTELRIPVEASYDAVVADLMDRARTVNTCTDLTAPVEVWLDPEGW